MEKYSPLSLFFVLLFSYAPIRANYVAVSYAKQVAVNFFVNRTGEPVANASLTYVLVDNTPGISIAGDTVLYVFNMDARGFVLVSAEDKTTPILGYGTSGIFVSQNMNTNLQYWVGKYQRQISLARHNVTLAATGVAVKWSQYYNNQFITSRSNGVNPLCQTTWKQEPYYNALCPYDANSGAACVVGCVATAMAQIMRYWSYPAKGTGSHTYTDPPYGALSVDFGTTTYNWGNMPNAINTTNNDIARLCYDCGIAVDMQYGTDINGGSGAEVITADAGTTGACAQNAFVTYFGYGPSSIQGLLRANYTTVPWQNILETDLNAGRPILYVGFDVTGQGGHAWVCDGYDTNDYFDMNWGWGGIDNGFYSLDVLDPSTFNFVDYEEALTGIEPGNTASYKPSASFTENVTTTCQNGTVNFTDESRYSPSSWKWSFPGGTPSTSTAQNPAVVYPNAGTYPVTLIATNTHGSDTLTMPNAITITFGTALPYTTGFGLSIPTDWTIDNTDNGSTWEYYFEADAAQMGCFADSKLGSKQILWMPPLDFSNATAANLTYSFAYAQYDYTGTRDDSLVLIYSANCDTTVHYIYARSGASLATVADTFQHSFIATVSQFRSDVVNLSFLAGERAVKIGFMAINRHGNNIFVGNTVTVTADSGIIPDASFNATPTLLNAGASTNFVNGSDYNGTIYDALSWNWSFPGGTPSTSTSPFPVGITYNTPGSYDVTLTATFSTGSATYTRPGYITVAAPVTGGCDTLSNILDAGDSALYIDSALIGSYLPVYIPVSSTIGQFQNLVAEQFDASSAGEELTGVYIKFASTYTFVHDAVSVSVLTPGASGAPQYTAGGGSILIDSIKTDGSLTFIPFSNVAIAGTFYISVQAEDYEDLVTVWTDTLHSNNPGTGGITSSGFQNWTPYANIKGFGPLSNYIFPVLCRPEVVLKPKADFEGIPATVTASNTVNFTDISYQSPSAWKWSFPGGTPSTSNAQNPLPIFYDTPGTYPVTLTVTNNYGADTLTKVSYITVTDKPSSSCDTLTNFSLNTLTVYENTNPYTGFAEEYSTGNDSVQVTGVGLYFAKAVYTHPGDSLIVYLFDSIQYGSGFAFPVDSQKLYLKNIRIDSLTVVNFARPYTIGGKFYVGYTFNPPYAGDTLILYSSPINETNAYTAYTAYYYYNFGGNAWGNEKIPYTTGVTVSNAIFPIVCSLPRIVKRPPLAAFTVQDTINCQGESIRFFDKTTNYPDKWNWSFPGGTPDTSNLQNPLITYNQPGVYPVTLTAVNDSGANTVIRSSYIVIKTPPIITDSITNLSCYGYNNGAIDVTVTGGTLPYIYRWSNGAFTQDLSGIAAGAYTLTLTDAAGCAPIISPIVIQPLGIILSFLPTSATCGQNNGSVVVNASGDTSLPINFKWSTQQTGDNLSGLTGGTYSLTATDNRECTVTGTVNIAVPGTITLNAVSTPTCSGSNGTAKVIASGGTLPYTYRWSNNVTDSLISGIPAGTYFVTVKDAEAGCQASDTVIVDGKPSITAKIKNPICYGYGGASIKVMTTGGSGDYNYTWSLDPYANVDSFGDLENGPYTVTVQDVNTGCTGDTTFTIAQPAAVQDTVITTHTLLNDSTGTAVCIATGGTPPYVYYWYGFSSVNSPDSMLSNLSAGSWEVLVTDSNGCSALTEFLISVYEPTSLRSAGDGLQFGIFPNPGNGLFQVSISNNQPINCSVQIFNTLGELVYTTYKTDLTEYSFPINLSAEPAGTYLVRLVSDYHYEVRRVVIVR